MDSQTRERLRLALSMIVDYLLSEDRPPFQDTKCGNINESSETEAPKEQELTDSVDTDNPSQ